MGNSLFMQTQKERRAGRAGCTQATLFIYDGGVLRAKTRFGPVMDICRLCLTEKHLIMQQPGLGTLNVEDEFYSACRHKEPILLSKIL